MTTVYLCCEVIGRDRDRLPNCGYGSVSSNGNLIANRLFNTANAPSLELLTGRSSEAVCRKRVFAGNTGHICHCAYTAVSRKGYGICYNRDALPNCIYSSIFSHIYFSNDCSISS